MANLQYQADPDNVQGDYEALPPGEYLVHAIESDLKPTKAGTGHYLEIKFEVLEGAHAGRQLFERLNIDNPNSQAVEIAQRSLNALCVAVGKLSVGDSEELHNLPVIAVVKVDPPRGDYGAGNSIKTYKPANAASAPAPSPTPAATTGAAKTPPWKKQAA